MINKAIAKNGVRMACQNLDIPLVEVYFEAKEWFLDQFCYANTGAVYLSCSKRNKEAIIFNENFVKNATTDEINRAAFHEVRHSYQKYMIDKMDRGEEVEDIDKIRRWKANRDNYCRPIKHDKSSLIDYAIQETEQDADEYATFFLLCTVK